MTLTQLDLALILTALHTERATARDDEWLHQHLTDLIDRIGTALDATAEPLASLPDARGSTSS